jgi:hypothetical protein
MQRSLFLARLIGPLFIVIGVGMMLNGAVYRALAEQFLHSHALIYLSGLLTLTIGLALVNAHNVWERDWRLIITVLGWLSLAGGTLRILAPQWVEQIGLSVMGFAPALPIGGVGIAILGLVLGYYGYVDSMSAFTSRARAPRATRNRRRR